MTVYTREGKDAVKVGDLAKVASSTLEVSGIAVKDRGWRNAKVLRFLTAGETVLAEVTVPGRAATRTVNADRLTHQRRAQ